MFQKVGFNVLPMTMNQEHVQYALNGTKNNDHFIRESKLKALPALLEDPVAIITSKTQKGTSVVALIEMEHNHKKVMIPVYIDGKANANGVKIDANAVTSVYARTNAQTLFDQAVMEEAVNGFGVLYLNQEKATDLIKGARVPMPKMPATSSNGFVHNSSIGLEIGRTAPRAPARNGCKA